MRKVLLFGIISFALLNSSSMFGQTKSLPIKTSVDSVSYAYGAALTQGLSMYLAQMGVVVDTTSIGMEYVGLIAEATDAAKKSELQQIMKLKMDSANTANTIAMGQFKEGFAQAMLDNKNSEAYNSGVSIASQVSGMLANFSTQMLSGDDVFNKELFVTAFMSALDGEASLLGVDPQELLERKMKEMEEVKRKEEADKLKAEYAEQIAAGDRFMAKNKKKKGVKTLPSGLQYKVVTKGTGATPSAYNVVEVHYKGTLIDGTQFDSSYDRGEPTMFGVSQVIKGWTEGLQLMSKGSKWIFYIPYDLAYGEAGAGENIKPFSNLIFEVELIDIQQVADVKGSDDDPFYLEDAE